MTYVVFSLGVAVGFTLGFFWPEELRMITRGLHMQKTMEWWSLKRNRLFAWALAAVTTATLFLASVGVAVLINGNQRSDLVRCLTDYNAQEAEARDERAAAYAKALSEQKLHVQAHLGYQQALLAGLNAGDGRVPFLRRVVEVQIEAEKNYLAALTEQQRSRLASQYPSPDLCERLQSDTD